MNNRSIRRTICLSFTILGTFLFLFQGNTAHAEDSKWHARFWNSKHFNGDVAHERYDSHIDFNWGEGSPAPGVRDDDFSAKWTRRVHFEPGTYRFTATMDDGMKVIIDDSVIIDGWWDSQEHTMTVDVPISGGEHDVKVEYYEAGNVAVAKVHWDLVHPAGQETGSGGGQFFPNWKAEYFNNMDLSGAPALVRDDRYLDHDWGAGSPAPGVIGEDFFSARWTKTLSGTPGLYHIHMTSDDGSRLYINNVLMIDNWAIQGPTTRAVDYNYPGGPVQIRVEFFEYSEYASIEVHLGIVPEGSRPTTPAPGAPSTSDCPVPTGFRATVNTGNLNFREGPSTTYAVLTMLPKCATVQLTGFKAAPPSTWVQVTLPDGRLAWANSSYMLMGTSLDQMSVLTD